MSREFGCQLKRTGYVLYQCVYGTSVAMWSTLRDRNTGHTSYSDLPGRRLCLRFPGKERKPGPHARLATGTCDRSAVEGSLLP